MNIPDKITADALENLLSQTTHAGKRPVSSTEFKPIAERIVQQLDDIYEELSDYIPDNVMHSRWEYVDKSRRSLRVALRTLQKAIKT